MTGNEGWLGVLELLIGGLCGLFLLAVAAPVIYLVFYLLYRILRWLIRVSD